MKYVNVFRTSDSNELAIIKNLFDDAEIAYRTKGEAMDSAANIGGMGNYGLQIEVEKSERQRAMTIIEHSGFVKQPLEAEKPTGRMPKTGNWIIVVLAALVMLIAIVLFVWFMNG